MQTPEQDIQLSATFHLTIETLKYNDFLKLQLDSTRTDLLIITGKPTPTQLTQAWETIQREYSDAVRSDKSSSLLECAKRCLRNAWLQTVVDSCLFVLRKGWNSAEAQMLADNGYPYIDNLQDQAAYQEQIRMVEMEANFLKVLGNQLANEYKLLAGNDDGESKVSTRTMDDYNKEIAIVSKFCGFGIDKCAISTAMWCGYLNAFFDHVEELKKQALNGRAV